MTRRQRPDQLSGALNELSALVLSLLRSPPEPVPSPFPDDPPPPVPAAPRRPPAAQMTPAGFASLMLGLSLSLMLCGSVTFFIGFVLMPWVIGLVMVLYVAGILSALSDLGRSVLFHATASPAARKDATSEAAVKRTPICKEGRTSVLWSLKMIGAMELYFAVLLPLLLKPTNGKYRNAKLCKSPEVRMDGKRLESICRYGLLCRL